MPTPNEHPTNQLEGMPSAAEESRFRTIAVRVEEDMHAQLRFIAQLSGTSISDEIRQAIERRITTAQDDPELITRAQDLRDEIEREAATRKAAIAGFMGQQTLEVKTQERAAHQRRTRKAPAKSGE
jgi:hypothetical protein